MEKALTNTLVQIAKTIIPGDGTVHLDAYNTLLARFGAKVTLPDMDGLMTMIPAWIKQETARSIIGIFASFDMEQVLPPLVHGALELLNEASDNQVAWFTSAVAPRLLAIVGNMMNFNVFWNLFLYSLFYYFVSYQPAKLSPGKRMLFHCCAVFPASWFILSYLISSQLHLLSDFTLPIWFVALLNNVRPAYILIFFLLVLFQKYNELEHSVDIDGKMDMLEYAASRMASLQFSVFASVLMIFVSLCDYLVGKIPGMASWGFGQATKLWMCIPILLLYSFNKKPRHKALDAVIPVYYVCHYLIVFFTWAFAVVGTLMFLSGDITLESLKNGLM